MKDSGEGIGIKNISDLVSKEIYGIYGQKIQQKKNLKIINDRGEIYEKFDNLSKEELNTKSNKNVYIKNKVMTNIIKHCEFTRINTSRGKKTN